MLWDRGTPTARSNSRGQRSPLAALGMQIEPMPVQAPNDFDSAFEAVRSADGLLLADVPLFTGVHRARIVELAAVSRLPAIYGYRQKQWKSAVSCRTVRTTRTCSRRAGTYVDKI